MQTAGVLHMLAKWRHQKVLLWNVVDGPAFAGWEGDIDIDLIVGRLFGPLTFFERVANFSFVVRTGRFNPFGIIAPGPHSTSDGDISAPSFADHSLDVFLP